MSVVLGYKFAAIPEWILYHPGLTGDDVRVYGVLARYGNDIRPSQQTIAEKISKSADTVKRSLHRLVEVGAVYVEARSENGAQLPNRYHLAGDERIESAPSGCTDAPRGGSTDAPRVGAPVHHEREQDNESKNNESRKTSSSLVDEAFDRWWALYPKKATGKGQARTKWRTMRAADRRDAFTGIERHAAWWATNETDLTFIPAGNVWLNQRRWEDDEPRSATPLTVVKPMGKMERVRAALAADDKTKTETKAEAR